MGTSDFSKPPAANQLARIQHLLQGLPATFDKGCTVDIATLANYAKTSRNTLNRDCRDILGISPGKVIMYHKISTAVYMLLSSSDDINNAIATAAGFGDTSCLYKQIRKTTGFSPQEIRSLRWL